MSTSGATAERPGELRVPEGAWLAVLWIVFAAAALAYGAMLPLGQGPDEDGHALFVRTLAGSGPPGTRWAWGLPVFETAPDDPAFEAHQPPLYYAVAAVAFRLGRFGAVRALSLVFGLALIWLTWRLVRDLWPAEVALGAAAVVALLPMNAFLATRVNNDPLANLLWAGALWRWTRTFRDGPSAREGIWCGLWIGAALLTKQSAIGLLALAVLVAALSARLSGQTRSALAQLAITCGLAALLAGWWYLRNLTLYGDLFAQQAFDARFLSTRMTPERLAQQFAHRPGWRYWPFVTQWTVCTFVIYIGHQFNRLPTELYGPQSALFLFAATGAVSGFVRRRRTTRLDAVTAAALLHGATLLLVIAMFVRFNQTYFQAQGRYLFLALPALALVLSAGPARWLPPDRRWRRYLLALAPLWFGVLNLLFLSVYVPGLVAQP